MYVIQFSHCCDLDRVDEARLQAICLSFGRQEPARSIYIAVEKIVNTGQQSCLKTRMSTHSYSSILPGYHLQLL